MKRTFTKTLLFIILLYGLDGLIYAQDPSAKNLNFQPEKSLLEDPATTPEAPLEGGINRIYRREIVVLGKDVTLGPNEVCRDMVVIGGDVTIAGRVEGDLVVVFGSAKVLGKVEGDLVVVLGSANLLGEAQVERDAVVVGGKLSLDRRATIGGARREFVFGEMLPDLSWIADWFRRGFLLARPLPPQLSWAWIVAGTFFVLYFVLAIIFARPLQACVTALQTTPAGSFFAGALGLFLLGPLVFLLIISVAGILVIPVLVFAFIAALVFGKLAIYRATGQQLGKQLNLAGLQHPVVALVIGVIIFYLCYTVPVLGFVVWGVATVWGLGAVLVAVFSRFRAEGEGPTITTTSVALAGVPHSSSPESPPSLPVSAEMVTLRRAGFWIRLWAALLDLVLLGTLTALVGPLFLLIWVAYHVAMWTWKGTTIGGIVAGLKIIRVDGQPINFSVALVRSLSSFFSAAVFFLGFFWAGWDRDKQAWHDKIAGTLVVRVPKGMSLV